MLIGEYIHTIDDKNRVSLPAKFRKEMGKKIILTPGLDNCLFVFTLKEWEKVSKRLVDKENDLSFLQSDKRSFNRFIFGRAVDIDVDSIGRILIPDFLKERINPKGKVAVVGVLDRLEIWNEDLWKKYRDTAEKEADKLAERLSEQK
jgi:MraZ protein